MPRTISGTGTPQSGRTACRVCTHPGKEEIDAMILNGTDYNMIIRRMCAVHPTVKPLTKPNLSRHKSNHLLNRPITVVDENGEKLTYITGAVVAERMVVPKEAIPDPVSLPDALAVIIAAGVINILQNPQVVTPTVLVQALELMRKGGLNSDEQEQFRQAWASLGKMKKELSSRARRKRTVTFEEEINVTSQVDPAPENVEPPAEPPLLDVTPDEWNPDELERVVIPVGGTDATYSDE